MCPRCRRWRASRWAPSSAFGGLLTTRFPRAQVEGDAAPRRRTTPDHVLLQGRLAGGAPVSIEVAGGRPPEAAPLLFEAVGEAGILALEGGAARGSQSGRLRLRLDAEAQPVDEGEAPGLPDAAANVAAVYAALRDDIPNGTSTVPGFGHAARLARLVADVTTSSESGARRLARGRPT